MTIDPSVTSHELRADGKDLGSRMDSGIFPWLWLLLAAGVSAAAISTNFEFLLAYPVEALLVVTVAAAASSLRVTAAAFPKPFTISMAPMALAILYSGAQLAWITYGLWLIGALVASVVRHRSLGQFGIGALLLALSGGAQTAVLLYYPEHWLLDLPGLSAVSTPIFLSVLAGFLVGTGLGGLGLLAQSRVKPAQLAAAVGWSRIVGLSIAEGLGAVLAHELAHAFWSRAFNPTRQGLFQASVTSAAVALVIAALLVVGRRQRRLAGREDSLTVSVNEMPWPAMPTIRE